MGTGNTTISPLGFNFDFSQLGQGLELLTTKKQTTVTNQSTTSNVTNRNYSIAYNIASGSGSTASSSQVASPSLSPSVSPSIAVIPVQGSGTTGSTDGSSSPLDAIMGNATGVVVIALLAFVGMAFLKKKK
jgi:hypothetical protein